MWFKVAHPYLSILFIVLTINAQAQWGDPTITWSQTCLGEQTLLEGNSTAPDSLISSWDWDLDSDGQFDDASGKDIGTLFPNAGDQTIALQITYTQSNPDTGNSTVTIDPLPEVNFNVDNLCEGQTGFYSSSSTIASGTINQFKWDFDDDGIIDETGESVTYICGPAQTYQTKLICTSDLGCEAFAVKTTSVHDVPLVSFSSSQLCSDQATQFENTSSIDQGSIALNVWSFGDGGSEDSEGNVAHTYAEPGVFTVNLTAVSDLGCRDSASSDVTITELPEAEVIFPDAEVIYGDAGVEARVEGDGIEMVSWSDGQQDANAVFVDPGVYTVDVTFNNACTRTLEVQITEELIGSVDIESDIITPNGDGFNDVFVVKNILGGEGCEVMIVDRWNRVVFESNDYRNDWGGSDLPTGAYFYKINCESRPTEIGNVNILK